MALLEVADLHVWYDLADTGAGAGTLHAVRGLTLSVDAGERVGLVGESGCGKSTALLALMALLPGSATVSGDVRLGGVSVLAEGERSMRPRRWREIAMVFQGAMNAFNPVRTVGAQIIEPMRVHRVAEGAAATARAKELLELVGIPGSAMRRYPHEFSGGMRQRAVLAMALACQPKVLLADEPTTALDTMVQAQILRLLDHLCDELGLALLLVTHDLPVVAQLCSRGTVMYAGTGAETGPMDQLFHDPRHPYTRMLFAATPDLHDDDRVVSIPGSPPRLDRPVTGCAFAPRCDRAIALCSDQTPPVWHGPGERSASCHLAADAAPAGGTR